MTTNEPVSKLGVAGYGTIVVCTTIVLCCVILMAYNTDQRVKGQPKADPHAGHDHPPGEHPEQVELSEEQRVKFVSAEKSMEEALDKWEKDYTREEKAILAKYSSGSIRDRYGLLRFYTAFQRDLNGISREGLFIFMDSDREYGKIQTDRCMELIRNLRKEKNKRDPRNHPDFLSAKARNLETMNRLEEIRNEGDARQKGHTREQLHFDHPSMERVEEEPPAPSLTPILPGSPTWNGIFYPIPNPGPRPFLIIPSSIEVPGSVDNQVVSMPHQLELGPLDWPKPVTLEILEMRGK